ncbi:MAG: hypothetical protein AAFY05_20645 [Pseudomonadota bacterium]
MRVMDKFHQHEALHTAHVVSQMWAQHVAQSQFVAANPELHDLAQKALEAMGAVYQAIGAVNVDKAPGR